MTHTVDFPEHLLPALHENTCRFLIAQANAQEPDVVTPVVQELMRKSEAMRMEREQVGVN